VGKRHPHRCANKCNRGPLTKAELQLLGFDEREIDLAVQDHPDEEWEGVIAEREDLCPDAHEEADCRNPVRRLPKVRREVGVHGMVQSPASVPRQCPGDDDGRKAYLGLSADNLLWIRG